MEPEEHRVRVAPQVDLRVLTWHPAPHPADDRDGDVPRTTEATPRTTGPAGAPPRPATPDFLLVHGLASNAWLWAGVAEELARAGHRAAAVDLRGHGGSSTPDDGYDFATVTADLVTVAAALEMDRPVVAGQSWGGNVVLELARRHPLHVRQVVCVDGGVIELSRQFSSWEACREALTPPPLAGTPLAVIERAIRGRHPDWPETGIRGTLANFDLRDDGTVAPHLPLEHHLAILRHLYDQTPSELHAEIEVPVLLLPVDDPREPDWTASKREAVAVAEARLRDVQVRWFTGDHDVHAQSPREVARAMLETARGGSGSERPATV